MFGRRHKVALVLAAVLTAAAACTNHARQQNADPAGGGTARGTLVASTGVLPHPSVLDAAYGAGGHGHGSGPLRAAAEPGVSRS